MRLLWLLPLALTFGCAGAPDPCLWTVTNNIGDLDGPTDLVSLHLRAEGEEWGENTLGEVDALPFGESYSFLLAPGAPLLDLRAVDGDGTTYSRFAENSCTDGTRHETVLTSDDLDIPCTWTITNDIGDNAVNYALFDLWIRTVGISDWGGGLLAAPLAFGDSVEFQVDVGWSYDLSGVDQDGVYFLRLGDQTCQSGQNFESTITLANEAPPCTWEATNEIDGGLGPLGIVAMEVIDGATGESFVTEFIPPIIEGESGTVPFWPRTIWTLRAYDELGQTYTYPESALCLDGGEFYALDVVADDVD